MSAAASRLALVIDDDIAFARVLARALGARGFTCLIAHSASEALQLCRRESPRHVVLDLKLGADNGLKLIAQLKTLVPSMRLLLLTGYASIATAVEAIKRGADDYLAKPADADAIAAALLAAPAQAVDADAGAVDGGLPLKRLECEQIQRVLNECGGNVSEAARQLGLHRRTLQRKLGKRPSGMH